MSEPRFAVAKYVPDLSRFEPRNIGVFLWANGKLRHKFLNNPSFIKGKDRKETYQRWLEFWKHKISTNPIRGGRGKRTGISMPQCLDRIIECGKGNYPVYDGGFLLQDIDDDEIDDALEFLFKEMVL